MKVSWLASVILRAYPLTSIFCALIAIAVGMAFMLAWKVVWYHYLIGAITFIAGVSELAALLALRKISKKGDQ